MLQELRGETGIGVGSTSVNPVPLVLRRGAVQKRQVEQAWRRHLRRAVLVRLWQGRLLATQALQQLLIALRHSSTAEHDFDNHRRWRVPQS